MSAFPESGRSDQQKLGEIRVRFRPEAVVQGINEVFEPEENDFQ
jgi:hypothetical protein